MPDYRFDLLDRISNDLINVIKDEELFENVMDVITLSLDKYEVSERCTELVPGDTSNEMLLKRYCACLLIDGKSQNTIKQYAMELRRFYLTVGKMFSVVNSYDIRMYLALFKQKGLSNRSLATMRSYIYAFFEWMTNEELIEKNPCARIKPIKYQRDIKKPFTDVEIDAIRSACETARERALIELLLASGIRRAELCDLRIGDINITEKSVLVRHGKGGKKRITYLNDLSLIYIKKYLDEKGSSDPEEKLFSTKFGDLTITGLRYVLKEIEKRSGVENIHPHRFRRTFATTLANRGMDIQEVQKLLGHASINTTMQYVCVDDTRVQNSYKKYSQNI